MEKRDRRNEILACALRLFATKGYHGTAITDIISGVQIARGTFYTYFKTKSAVFTELVDSAVETLTKNLHPVLTGEDVDRESVLRQLRINLSHALGPLFADPCLAKLFLSDLYDTESEASTQLASFYAYLTTWLQESIEEGVALQIVRRCNPRITAISIVGMLRGILRAVAMGEERLDFHEVVEEITANVARGIIL